MKTLFNVLPQQSLGFVIGLALWLIPVGSPLGAPLGTEFSYQGYMTESGSPASGPYDLQFRLFDAPAGGLAVGPTVAKEDVVVQSGLFSVGLDFGGVFAGQALWIELGFRPGNSNGAFTVFGDRQAVLAAPYALHALGGAGGSGGDAFVRRGADATFSAGNVGIGTTTPSAPLEVRGDWDRGNGVTVPALSLSGAKPTLQWEGAPLSSGFDLGPRISWILHQGAEGPGSLQFFSRKRSASFVGGGTDTGWRRVLSLTTEGQIQADGAGLVLNPLLGPVMTRGFAPFNVAASSPYYGHGRWGMFVEAQTLVAGIPDKTAADQGSFQVRRYYEDGSNEALFTVSNTNGTTVNSEFLMVQGFGNEQAYIGGEGVGADVEVGSRQASVSQVTFWNRARNEPMNIYSRDANVRALVIRGGADLAEPFPISQNSIDPGSVVVIDDEQPGKLRMSDRAHDTRVAGIVSGANGIRPGISMIQEDALEPGVNVALSGRVYVKAETSSGPIRPGDLLTTSDRAGHAMRVADPMRSQGAVLGKAMTRLDQGTGMVLVLVSLQ